MPYDLDWEPVGVYRRYHGQLTDLERRTSLAAIWRDRRFDDLRYAITDFLAVTTFEEHPAATEELAALNIAPLLSNTRLVLAAVAVDPQHLRYIERIKAAGFIGVPYEVFATLPEARRWVAERTGVDVGAQRPLASGAGG